MDWRFYLQRLKALLASQRFLLVFDNFTNIPYYYIYNIYTLKLRFHYLRNAS
jgi:hypothetical protein